MNILGLNFAYHDSTACVVQDGRLTVAIEEERLTRRKHTTEFPARAIARCLAAAGLTPADLDHIAVSTRPGLDWPRKAAYGLGLGLGIKPFLEFELLTAGGRLQALHAWLTGAYGAGRRPRLHFVPHHLAHGVGSFLVSPYERAAILSVDGSGEWATTYKGSGRGAAFTRLGQDFFPYSLGSVYEAATEFCGFLPNYDEGKTMGLAPLGDPAVFGPQVEKLFWINDDLSLGVDRSFFNYPAYRTPRCGAKFTAAFGRPRKPGREAEFEAHHLNVAAAFQQRLEDCLLRLARLLRERTREEHLVIAGGVALNSVANGRLVRESGFRDLYVMPAAGDNGTALGAAAYVQHVVLGRPREWVHLDPYVGTGYSAAEIDRALRESKLPHRVLAADAVVETAAALLRRGAILGWFQGRMEIGPRALGNRSILADPTRPEMKDKINAEVKHREAFRPFAPSCPIEDTPRYFDQRVADPFMLKVCDVRPESRALLPAITHVDGTARLQTVHAETNPRFHALLKAFGRLSGAPVLLNTSFNVMGEPIVESPLDAVRCYASTGLDALIIGDRLLEKNPS